MNLKAKLKEVVFECGSEAEAQELFNQYRKDHFHLVSKKVTDPETNAVVIKLIRFTNEAPANNLDTVWENFVFKMKEAGFSSTYITMILESIKAKSEFWKMHPQDHLHSIVFDITKFKPANDLSQRLCLVADPNVCQSFWCSLQKTLKYYIKARGFSVVVPKSFASEIESLKITKNINIHTYDEKSLNLESLSQSLNSESGLWLLSPEAALELGNDYINNVCSAFDISLLMDAKLDVQTYRSLFSLPCSIVSEYEKTYTSLFSALEKSYFYQIPISFFWDGDQLGEMQNPERQTIKALEEAFKKVENKLATVA